MERPRVTKCLMGLGWETVKKDIPMKQRLNMTIVSVTVITVRSRANQKKIIHMKTM
jgi:hypothetical protein